MQPNHPQQGYGGPQQPYAEPGAPRASAGAAGLAGVLGLLTAAALVWTVIEYFVNFEIPMDAWPSEVWIVVIVRAALALLLLVLAGVTMARRIGAAWSLVLLGLLAAATVVLEPLVSGSFDGWFEALFEFGDTSSIAMVAAGGLGLLTAIFAIFAGASRSAPEYGGFE